MFSCFFLSMQTCKFLPVTIPALIIYTSMDYLEKAGRVLDIEIFELKRLRERLGENFSRAVELIKETADARGKVVVVGVGKSGHIGARSPPLSPAPDRRRWCSILRMRCMAISV